MPYQNVTKGLTLKIPTRNTTNWDSVLLTYLWEVISAHKHEGSGDGNQITSAGLENNSVNDLKIRLRNAQWLRGRNAADTGDISILRVNSSDAVEINVSPSFTVGSVFENEPGAAPSGLTSGKTYMQPNYILGAAITYTIVTGAYMSIIGFMTINGTLTVDGELRVV